MAEPTTPKEDKEADQTIDNFVTANELNESDLETISATTFHSASALMNTSGSFSDALDDLHDTNPSTMEQVAKALFDVAEMVMEEISILARLIDNMRFTRASSDADPKVEGVNKKLMKTSDQVIDTMASLAKKMQRVSLSPDKKGDDDRGKKGAWDPEASLNKSLLPFKNLDEGVSGKLVPTLKKTHSQLKVLFEEEEEEEEVLKSSPVLAPVALKRSESWNIVFD